MWQAELLLGEYEHVVPQPGLEMALELRQVKVRARAAVEQRMSVVEAREPEVEEARGDRSAVHEHMPLLQMPRARPDDERRRLVRQPARVLRRLERDRLPDGVTEALAPGHDVRPRRCTRVHEVGPE